MGKYKFKADRPRLRDYLQNVPDYRHKYLVLVIFIFIFCFKLEPCECPWTDGQTDGRYKVPCFAKAKRLMMIITAWELLNIHPSWSDSTWWMVFSL